MVDMLPRIGFRRRVPKRLSRTWTYPSTSFAVARPSVRVRGTLWKYERCISKYVCQRDCKHMCTRIQAHPDIYQQYLKSPTQILKESYTTPPTQYHPRSPIFEETVSLSQVTCGDHVKWITDEKSRKDRSVNKGETMSLERDSYLKRRVRI